MEKAYIFNDPSNSADRTKVEEILRDAGYDSIWSVPSDISLIDADTNIGVVCLPAAAEDLETINVQTQAFAGAGIRVIGIWLGKEKDGGGGIPEAIGKYGMTVDIGSPNLIKTLKGEADVWEGSGGVPNPTPTTKRNKC